MNDVKNSRTNQLKFELSVRFVQFLDSRHCLDSFVRYLKFSRKMSLSRYLYIIPVDFFVSHAFNYSDTFEGYEFWSGIDVEWYNYIHEFNL